MPKHDNGTNLYCDGVSVIFTNGCAACSAVLAEREAQKQAAHKERCERMVELINVFGLRCGHDPNSDVISFEYHGHKFQLREVGGE